MSRTGKSLLSLLQRCVSIRPPTLPVCVTAGAGFVPQRTWTSTTRTGYAQRLCRLRSAAWTGQLGLCTKAGAPIEDEYPPLPAYQSDPEPKAREVYIVQVKGLPWACTAQDLLQFFSECRICDGEKGIHLTVDRQGRPSGRAFIEMEHEADVGKALEKHRQYMGARYVEVYEVTNSDAEALLKKATPAEADDCVVWLRGLPFSSDEADIAQFFSGLDIAENGITIILNHRGRNSGQAYVQFSSKEAADEALRRNREVMGSRYIEVYPRRRDEIYSSQKPRMSSASPQTVPASQTTPKTGFPQSSAALSHYVHMRGLPYHVSGEDIVTFFSPLVVTKILIECGPNGRPSGEADVFFTRHQDAVAAMSRDRQYIGERYIELFMNSTPNHNGQWE